MLNKRELSKFLVDFSCASSVLEGGTYSLLDTQALFEYGEKSAGKPLKDAFLVLNHKEAFEYLHDHMQLDSIFRVHDLLTSDHDLPDLKESIHFLPKEQRGVTREYTDVDIRFSSYLPPFRPGTGYLQPFYDGNKRTSRAMCNVPLIRAKRSPISFVDFGKQDYLVSMLAFY